MDKWLLSFLLGSILALLLPHVPVLFYETLLIVIIITWAFYKQYRVLLSCLLGFVWLCFHAYQYQYIWQLNQINKSVFFQQKHDAKLTVLNIPRKTEDGWQFNATVTSLNNKLLQAPITVRLTWQTNNESLQNNAHLAALLKLKPAHGLANAGGFDYQRWLRSEHIHATGYIVPNTPVVINTPEMSIRANAFAHFNRLTSHLNSSPLLQALTFGEKSNFGETMWQVLTHTGTQHLVAISGLHIGLMVSFSYLLTFGLLKFFPAFLLQKIIRSGVNWVYVAISCALVSAAFYSYIAGFALPTIRALIFFIIYALGQMFALRLPPARLILFSVFVTVLLLPSSLYSTSFWLSYLAVSAVMVIYWRVKHILSPYQGIKRYLLMLIAVQFGLAIVLAPVTAVFFNQYASIAFIANLIALPVISVLVMPVIFAGLFSMTISDALANVCFIVADRCLTQLWQLLTWLANLPLAHIELSAKYVLLISSVALFITMLYLFSQRLVIKPFKPFFITVFSLLALTGFVGRANNSWTVTALDVGQGLSVIIEKNGKAVIYDTGNSYPSGWSMSSAVIQPYLSYQGVSPETLIISHDDSDHASGLTYLLEQYSDIDVVFNKNVKLNSKGKHLNCIAGQRLTWQKLTFEMLWPNEVRVEENDDSCVIRISDGQHHVLLTGDITTRVERELSNTPSAIAANVIVAPHHGSKSSSSLRFIKAVNPQYAIFSAGFFNQWRMPNDGVVARYNQQGVQWFNTADNGMIRVSINEGGIDVYRYRQDIMPYWFSN